MKLEISRSHDVSPGRPRGGQAGFSLVELLIAMVVTLIVSGAIFGLMTSGQASFRREPEVTERQQNIRVAMDLVQRDIGTAGMGMTGYVQAFTDNLNNSPTGLPSVVNPGENSDELEIAGNDGTCPNVTGVGGAGNNVDTWPIPSCFPEDSLVYMVYPGETRFGVGFNIHAQDTFLNFPPGQQLPAPYAAPNPPYNVLWPTALGVMNLFKYVVAPDPSDGSPALWRSTTGGIDFAGGAYVPPPGGTFQLIARGVEDMQVQYLNGNGVWQDTPGAVNAADINTIVREVRVTFSARVLGRNLQGETTAANVPTAIRGELTSSTVPRAALETLSAGPAPVWQ